MRFGIGICVLVAVQAGLAACSTLPNASASQNALVAGPVAAPVAAPVTLQILALNDFHGALETPAYDFTYTDGVNESSQQLGGAARLAASLQGLREGNAHTITVAAGDMIGASPIVSSRFLDEPAIGALNRAGLEIASVGNHEFDRGIAELLRIQHGGCDKFTPGEPCQLEQYAGAQFAYLAGNTVDEAGVTLLPGTALREFGALTVGFVGLTLEGTPELVAPSAVAGWRFLDEAQSANQLAASLMRAGADLVVLLLHEGARVDPRFNLTGCPLLSGPIVPIIEQLDPAIRLVVSGHTHQAYVCEVAGADGSPRLLTSAGAQGSFVTDIRLTIEPGTGALLGSTAANIPVTGEAGEDAEVAAYVAQYSRAVEAIAKRPLGLYEIAADDPDNAQTCRDTPSQRLIADTHAAATVSAEKGAAQFALTNAGGVRTQLPPGNSGALNFGQIYEMQPFGNTVLTMELSGAQIMEVLESQFCGSGRATICVSLLIPSQAFRFSYDLDRPAGERIISATLNGKPLDREALYRVAVNDFMAKGGGGLAVLAQGKVVADAGFDLDVLERYLGAGEGEGVGKGVAIGACGRVRDLTGG